MQKQTLSPVDYYKLAFKKWTDFDGRATSPEYRYFALFNFILAIVASIIDGVIGIELGGQPIGIIYILLLLVTLIPSISVGVRRLHDINKSGRRLLIALVPLVGGIRLIVLLASAGTKGPNTFGPDPKDTKTIVEGEVEEEKTEDAE